MSVGVTRPSEPAHSPTFAPPGVGPDGGTPRRSALPRRLGFWEATLLVIGVPFGGPGATADVVGSLAPLLGNGARHPVMLVRTRAEAA